MYRKKWDKETKTMKNVDTGNIIITVKGSKIKDSIRILEDRIGIRVRPYVPR